MLALKLEGLHQYMQKYTGLYSRDLSHFASNFSHTRHMERLPWIGNRALPVLTVYMCAPRNKAFAVPTDASALKEICCNNIFNQNKTLS